MNLNNMPPGMNDQLQRLMSNPQIMAKMQQLMMKPGGQAKIMALMKNPNLITTPAYAHDPDIQELTRLMSGMGGGMGAQGMGNLPRPTASSSTAIQPGSVTHVKTEAHFRSLLMQAQSKLVVVDYYAEWCGPCKRIAPVFVSLAKTHAATSMFLKVNVDDCKMLAENQGIKAMPTFQFYRNGRKIDEFKGADLGTLRSRISRHSRAVKVVPKVKPCPYTHFPLARQNLACFAKASFDKMGTAVAKANKEMEGKDTEIDEKDMGLIEQLISVLKQQSSWHTTKLSTAGSKVLLKMLDWQGKSVIPVFDLWRIFLLHPDAGRIVKETGGEFVLKAVKAAGESDIIGMLLLRGLCNATKTNTRDQIISLLEQDFLEDINIFASSKKENTRMAYTKFVLNIVYCMRAAEASGKDADFVEYKVLLVTAMQQMLLEEKSPKVVYRILTAVGGLMFRNKIITDMVTELALLDTIEQVEKTFEKEDLTQQVCKEIKRALKDPEA